MRISAKKYRNLTLPLKPVLYILMFLFLSIAISLVLSQKSINLLVDRVEKQYRQGLINIISVARNSIEPILKKVRSGEINRAEAIRLISPLIRNMTYEDQDGKNYIFMTAYDGTSLVQPFDIDIEMSNRLELKDKKGFNITRELIKSAKIHPEGSFVRYNFSHLPNINDIQEKMTYVIGIPEIECYIASGMYMQRVIQEQKEILTKIKYSSIYILIVLLFPISISFFIIYKKNRHLLIEINTRKKAEEDLKQSEAKFRSIFENSTEGIYQTDKEGLFINANPALCRIAGYESSTDMISTIKNINQYYADTTDREKFLNSMDKTGLIRDYKVQLKRKDGTLIWVLNSSRSIKNDKGDVLYYEGSIEDITDKVKAESDIKESRKLLSDILKAASEFSIIATDQAGIITIFNHGSELMLGYSSEEMIGKQSSLILHSDKEIAIREKELTAELGYTVEGFNVFTVKADLGISEMREWTYIRKDGSVLPVSLVISPIRSGINEITGYLGIATDISLRKHTEKMSRESEEKFTNIFMTVPDCIAIIHMQDEILIDVNQGFEDITGFKRKDIIGQKFFKYGLLIDQEEHNLMLNILNSGRDVLHHELQFTHKNGSLRTGIYSARPIQIADKACIIIILQDVTEQRRLEEDRYKLEMQLSQSQKMDAIGKLAGGVAHDFNNILMGIQGISSMILMDINPEDPNYNKLKQIEDNVKRGANLTRQLLGFAREGKYEIKIISINNLIQKSSQFFIETRKEISIDYQFQDDLFLVEADSGQLEQVFLNIFINAAHSMPDGGHLFIKTCNIKLQGKESEVIGLKPGDFIKISISDTGTGIEEKNLKRIFEPFFTTKSEQGGTGLGLASAYGIIRNHGGIINAYSELGHGATFNIYLPSSEKNIDQEKDNPDDKKLFSGKGGILVIEDEPAILEVATELLKILGYTVYSAENEQEAVIKYSNNQKNINLVILDMILRGTSGSQVLIKLKKINPDVKVILSSGYGLQGEVQKVMEMGCLGFIQKPYNFKDLSDIIHKALK